MRKFLPFSRKLWKSQRGNIALRAKFPAFGRVDAGITLLSLMGYIETTISLIIVYIVVCKTLKQLQYGDD